MTKHTQIIFLLITAALGHLTYASSNSQDPNKRKRDETQESNVNQLPTKKQRTQLTEEEKRIFERFAHSMSDAMKPSWENTIRLELEKLPEKSLSSARDSDGNTFLHWAAFKGYNNTLAYLLEHGATIDAENNEGATPLFAAAAGNNIVGARTLLKNKANPSLITDHNKLSPLMRAVMNRNYEMVNLLLLATSINVNDKDSKGNTPLTEILRIYSTDSVNPVALQNRMNIIRALLQAKADLNIQSDNGKWPIIQALELYLYELLPAFVQGRAFLNVENKDQIGLTPLLVAMKDGQVWLVKYLIEHGANPHYQNKNGISGLNFYTTPNNNLIDPNMPDATIAEIQLILDTIPKKGM